MIVRLEVANAELRAQNVKLSREWEPFQQTAKYFAGEANGGDRFRFVEDHQDSCEVKWLCELLEAGARPNYIWRAGGRNVSGGQSPMRS